MPRHIAFLRAINVGGHNVKMETLRALFESLGFDEVETFIASGNVIFETKGAASRSLEEKIEKQLAGGLGYEVVTFVRSPAEVSAIAAYEPFPGAEGNALSVALLRDDPSDEAIARVMA